LAIVLDFARDLLADRTPIAIGVSFGGPVNPEKGQILLSHHVPGWENFPLREHLQAAIKAPVYIDNDANAAALGEWRFGAGVLPPRLWPLYVSRVSSLLYVTVSTGVGSGFVGEGQVWRGVNRLAGEIGHIVLDPNGPQCVCGKRGCVEALASGPSIARQVQERLVANPRAGQILRDLMQGDLEAITAARVAHAADEGDEVALEALAISAQALGRGLGIAINLINPERIVLGGGVIKSGERYVEMVREAARAHVLPGMSVDIMLAALGDDAPLWGAVAMVS
jgi:glucokinase